MKQPSYLPLSLCGLAFVALLLSRSQREGPRPAQAAAFSAAAALKRTIPRHCGDATSLSAKVEQHPDVDASADQRAFREWCDSVGLRAPHLEHAPTDGGVPGVKVRPGATLHSGEAAIVLPLDATLAVLADDGVDPGSCGSSANSVMNDDLWSEADPELRLASRLLHERSLGSASRFHGYIRHRLPPVSGPGRERCDALGRWTDAELRLLRSPALTRKAENRRKMDNEWFRRLTEERSATSPGGDEHSAALTGGNERDDGAPPAFTREEFDWALDVVRTRHFRGDFAPGLRHGSEERKDDYALLPFVDDLNHRAETSGAFHLKFSTEALDGDRPPTIAPVSEALNRASDAVCWVAHRPFHGGEEVALAYLTGSDAIAESFLDEWGFVLSAEEMDACAVYVGDIRCIVRGDGFFHEEDSMVDAIGAEVLRHFDTNDDEEPPTKRDTWRLVAKACYNEFLLFEGNESVIPSQDTSSPSRRAIANMFVEGKQRLLHAGLQHALLCSNEQNV